jgi:hypothetical protein
MKIDHRNYSLQRSSSGPNEGVPFSASEAHDSRAHRERLLDDALAASFPCSDPLSTLTFCTPAESELDPP